MGADETMIKKIASLLEAEHAAYGIAGYRDASAGLRICAVQPLIPPIYKHSGHGSIGLTTPQKHDDPKG
jgi:hypothetical protein